MNRTTRSEITKRKIKEPFRKGSLSKRFITNITAKVIERRFERIVAKAVARKYPMTREREKIQKMILEDFRKCVKRESKNIIKGKNRVKGVDKGKTEYKASAKAKAARKSK